MSNIEIFKGDKLLENTEVTYLDAYLLIPGAMSKLYFTFITEEFSCQKGKMIPEFPANTGFDYDQAITSTIHPISLETSFNSTLKVSDEIRGINTCYGLYFCRAIGAEPVIAVKFARPIEVYNNFTFQLKAKFTTGFSEEYFDGVRETGDPVTNITRRYFYSVAPPAVSEGYLKVDNLETRDFIPAEMPEIYKMAKYGKLAMSSIGDGYATEIEQYVTNMRYDKNKRSIISADINVQIRVLTQNIPAGEATNGFIFRINKLQDFPMVFFYEKALKRTSPNLFLEFNYRSTRRE